MVRLLQAAETHGLKMHDIDSLNSTSLLGIPYCIHIEYKFDFVNHQLFKQRLHNIEQRKNSHAMMAMHIFSIVPLNIIVMFSLERSEKMAYLKGGQSNGLSSLIDFAASVCITLYFLYRTSAVV